MMRIRRVIAGGSRGWRAVVNVTVEQGRLEVRLTGWDRVWALKGQLSFPIEHVERAEIDPGATICRTWKGVRLPGTALPGVIVAGSYWWKDGWTFWSVRFRKRIPVLLIFLRNERYHRLALTVDDPEAVIANIRASLA